MLRFLSLIFPIIFLTACAGRNVVKGDSDFPVENPNPRYRTIINVTLPNELQVSFKAGWRATNESCKYDVSGIGSAYTQYSVLTDLEVRKSESVLTVPVFSDKYLPGRCGWSLSVIQLFLSRGEGYPQQVDVYYSTHERTAGKKLDVWCRKPPASIQNEKVWGVCSTSRLIKGGNPGQPTSLAISKYDPKPASVEVAVHFDE